MRTLRPRLLDPLLEAVAAGELGAVRTHHSILNRAETNETAEHFLELHGRLLLLLHRALVPANTRIDGLDATPAAIAASRSQRGDIVLIRIVALVATH